MIMKRSIVCLAIICGAISGGAVDAAVIMDQKFDETGVFSPGITGNVGDATNVGGRWGAYDLANTRISDTVSLSGQQSMVATRGGSGLGRTDAVVSTDLYEVSYAINRETADSQLIVQVGNHTSVSGALDLATFTRSNGIIHVWGGAWVETGVTAPVGEWTTIRMLVDAVAMSYGLYVTPEGGSETFVQTVSLAGVPAGVNSIRLNPQGTAGTVTYFDNAYINEVPEPATLGLMGLGGLMLIRRS